jgi:SAM-dependent methyltransferase
VTLSLVQAAAARHAVTPAIHARDFIYKFVLMQGGMTLPDAVNYYFDDGARSARQLAERVAATVPTSARPLKLLEFAAGYGCVTRHLSKYSEFELVSCDIHSTAIDFLAEQLGVKAIPSTVLPERFAPPNQFDVVFALSFFSHMPRATFGRWLRSLYDAVRAPGCLIFTTHGMDSRKYMGSPHIPADGFWFSASSEQDDLDKADYGLSITTPEFVRGEIERQIGAVRVESRLAFWWEHQDLWVVHRESESGSSAGKR